MTLRATYSNANTHSGEPFDDDEPHLPAELFAGEPIGTPIADRRGKGRVWIGTSLIVALGGAWAIFAASPDWPDRIITEATALLASLSRQPRPTNDQAAPVLVPTSTNAPASSLPTEPIAPLPPSATQTEASTLPVKPESLAAPLRTAALAPVPAVAADAPAERLPPLTADPADPNQKRALAVGLHPELSRVLLARMTQTDYRNAGIAIRTALAETPDTEMLVWPRERRPELARFQVRFVTGADPACRRYVVSVLKDGWLTTALPMEKCKS